MLLKLLGLVCLCVLTPTTAFAEGGCPPGKVPQQGNGWKTCIPVSGSDANTSGSQFHGPSTEARWISIAVDKVGVCSPNQPKATPVQKLNQMLKEAA
jgi:hypothetical protein